VFRSIESIRADFPALARQVYGKPLVYLDNAATTQKPSVVIDAVSKYYREENANVHRGVHRLSQDATTAYEAVRTKLAAFIHAERREVIFTRGTTESINLVAWSFGEAFVKQGDEILVSALEHHSNIVPWQQLCLRKGAGLKVIPVNPAGEIDMDAYKRMLGSKTRIVAVSHISNSLGTINPIAEIISLAHEKSIPVLIDGAQGFSHGPVDVKTLDCDFYAFSAHKAYGPMGIGGLFGKAEWLDRMPPYQGGGEMIERVSFEKTTFNELPYKFEAGTPSVADAIGFGASLDYLDELGWDFIRQRESDLLGYATSALRAVPGITIFGTAKHKASIISFLIGNIHFFDAGTILDHMGIAVRTGNHCTQPLMDRLGILGTLRASFSFYNTREEADALVNAVIKVKELFE
jgi:cysteine desulfurase/selenocysteine lyase